MVRLTIDGSSCQFSTKSEVSVKLGDQKASRTQRRSKEAVRLNFYFDFFKRSRLKVTKRSANKPIWLP